MTAIRLRRIGHIGLLLAMTCFAAHCTALCDDTTPAPAKKAEAPAVPSKPETTPPSEEECLEWGVALEEAIVDGEVAKFDELIDLDAILAKATMVPGNPPEVEFIQSEFIKGFKQATQKGPGGLYHSTMKAANSGGDFRLLRSHTVDGEPRVLFRLILANGALNYHDFILGRDSSGKLRAVDLYVFLLGEKISNTARRSFLPQLEKRSRGIVERLLGAGGENEYVKSTAEILRLAQAVREERRHPEAIEIYNRLPESVRKDKTVMILYIQATQTQAEADYLAALNDYQTLFPNDPSLDLMQIDLFVLKKSYDKALESVDRVEKTVGGDPYLDVVRSNLFLLQNNGEKTREVARRALAEDETLIYAYWPLVTISMQEKKFDETVELLNQIEMNFDLEFNDLKSEPAYTEFVKSPQYEAWMKSRADGKAN